MAMYCSGYQYGKTLQRKLKEKHSLIILVQIPDCNCHLRLNGRESLDKFCTAQP